MRTPNSVGDLVGILNEKGYPPTRHDGFTVTYGEYSLSLALGVWYIRHEGELVDEVPVNRVVNQMVLRFKGIIDETKNTESSGEECTQSEQTSSTS